MQLTDLVKRQLENDKDFLTAMLSKHGKVDANLVFSEETVMILLVTVAEIQKCIKKAVAEFFGANYSVSSIRLCCGNKLIIFTITKNC